MPRINSPEELEKVRQEIVSRRDPSKPCISICAGAGCMASGAGEVIAAFKAEIEKQGLQADVNTRETGCPGFCERGPVVVIYPEEICYLQVKSEDVPEIVSQTIKEKKVVDRLVYVDPTTGEKATRESDIPFYKNQKRNIIGSNIKIDPKSIEDYLAIGGYSALAKVLSRMSTEEVLEEVKKSNLRGRGGGGFPTGRKWEESRNAPGETKYVIVNADEGDPGAFMDRALLEGNPHSILEGLTIGAYAVGAHEGFIYVRQEYPIAVENVTIAIKQAEEYGFLGGNILGSGFDFTVKVHQGAGAFVCGESSALMTALEGRAGEPRPKYIHTAVKGIWDRPSVLNNVETWANVPLIIHKGADWFTQFGTEKSKGTKIFSLVGKINNTGLVEVPMGITLRDIIYKIGGGIPGGKRFRPILTVTSAEICGIDPNKVLPTACAVELIHSYSLVHDDLPSMDNDDYRRDKLTVHRKFNEGMAILTGDALLTKAFELIAENSKITGISEKKIVEVIKIVSNASGADGMVGGQVADTFLVSKTHTDKLVNYIHSHKTAALIKASVLAGAVLAGGSEKEINALKNYGEKIGFAFQIADDMFDVKKDRVNYSDIYGTKKSERDTNRLIDEAKKSLEVFGSKKEILSLLADYVVTRKN